MMERKNAYSCPKCGHRTITIDLVKGVTPMFFPCEDCNFYMARSSFYRGAENETPTWEWYLPTEKQAKRQDRKAPGSYDHWKLGGLTPRRITGTQPADREGG